MSNDVDLAQAQRRVQRFAVALGCLLAAVLLVKGCDLLFARSARARQAECEENLRAVCFAQRQALATKKQPITRLGELPAPIPRGNRYAYFLGPGPLEERAAAESKADPAAAAVGVDLVGFQAPQGMKLTVAPADLPKSFAGGVGLGPAGACPDCAVVAACAGNLDVDDDLDVWSVSTGERKGPKGEAIPPCQPFNDQADLAK